MATLWILMVLAPFGFVFLILPATRSYAQKWWTTLQSQALFAPAFMFFIIITVKMSNADLFGIVGRINSNPNMGATDLIFLLIIQSTVIFLLLGGSLIVAKTLGIYGAGAAISMAAGAGKAFRGYVGRGAWAPFRYTGKKAGEAAGVVSGRIAQALPDRLAGPFAKVAARTEAAERKRYDEQAKRYSGASPRGVAQVLATAKPELQRALLDQVKGKKRELALEEMEEFSPGSVAQLGQNMKAFGLEKDVVRASNSLTIGMKILNPQLEAPKRDLSGVPRENWTEEETKYQEAMDKIADVLTNAELSNLSPSEITNNANVQMSLFGTVTPQRFNALLRNRAQRDAIVEVIQRQTKNITTISGKGMDAVKILFRTQYRNHELADRIGDNVATNLFAGTIRTRGETGGQPFTPPPAEEREET